MDSQLTDAQLGHVPSSCCDSAAGAAHEPPAWADGNEPSSCNDKSRMVEGNDVNIICGSIFGIARKRLRYISDRR